MAETPKCYHCGDACLTDQFRLEEKPFCCQGCLTVYQLISQGGLSEYYLLEKTPGHNPEARQAYYDFLDDEQVQERLLRFRSEKQTIAELEIPGIHCSSCIWLLENLEQLLQGVQHSAVNFVRKRLTVHYDPSATSLRSIAELLASLGYPAAFSLDQVEDGQEPQKAPPVSREMLYKLGIAGFCFGNIMLLYFPEYLNVSNDFERQYQNLFAWTSLVLSLPVLLYSGFGYLRSAWRSLSNRYVNLDVPIALGILTLFGWSAWEIITQTGHGYLDSLAGLIFFLLIGKFFQERTYQALSFERDYRSFFPIAVTRVQDDAQESCLISNLQVDDMLLIRNGEVVPVDGELMEGKALLDYSFITGEAEPQEVAPGATIYAGGKQVGPQVKVRVRKKLNDSELLSLWNSRNPQQEALESEMKQFTTQVSKYFTAAVLVIALSTLAFWLAVNPERAVQAFSAVLIIACPCALALSVPFTYGSVMRQLARRKFYIKSADKVEALQGITDIVFDKTGTLTTTRQTQASYTGVELTGAEAVLVKSATANSLHNASRSIANALGPGVHVQPLQQFAEEPGEGLEAEVQGQRVRVGRLSFVAPGQVNGSSKGTYVSINGELKGSFSFRNTYRPGTAALVEALQKQYTLHLLSGDDDTERQNLAKVFPQQEHLHFRQKPQDKQRYVEQLQAKGRTVCFVGDGLNDAGALQAADFGISITDDATLFTPAADGILEGKQLPLLPRLLGLARNSRKVLLLSFAISFLYNIVGLSFAVQGLLSPVIAAILMPLSSVTIVAFATGAVHLTTKRMKL